MIVIHDSIGNCLFRAFRIMLYDEQTVVTYWVVQFSSRDTKIIFEGVNLLE